MIKIYTAQKMTGRYYDEMLREAEYLVRSISERGWKALNPVVEEKVPDTHEILYQSSHETLEKYWRRDKEMLRESDIVLDYKSCNTSDGVNVEVGYGRWCLWKPTIRVWPGAPINISRLEVDLVCENLEEAINAIESNWGDYKKLGLWRDNLLDRSFKGWLEEQNKINIRYGLGKKLVTL